MKLKSNLTRVSIAFLAFVTVACGSSDEKDEAEADERAPPASEAPATDMPFTFANPEVREWKGTGDKVVSDNLSLKKGGVIFKATHDGSSNFIVVLRDAAGERIEGVVNEIGLRDEMHFVEILADGNYMLEITADGAWAVSTMVPGISNATLEELSGNGSMVSDVFPIDAGKAYKVTGKYVGERNFIVWLFDAVTGEAKDLLFNELKSYEGEKIVSFETKKHAVLEVLGEGSWSIKIEAQ